LPKYTFENRVNAEKKEIIGENDKNRCPLTEAERELDRFNENRHWKR